ncbi:GntR family transcriptional regulator [Rhizobium sp. 18055]|uniref:GntR family transcriptional regulator n=1 Tax=Rhizobium sp. 18055 TaxID=2681403 RepID=UPI00135C5F26|nr:GntR family transcriptional regulator [Rhizobium sp. 18055]
MAEKIRVMLVGRIAEIIHHAEMREGDRLFEARLATKLDVSRAPVRAALDTLVEKGFVAHLPNKGYILARELVAVDVDALQGGETDLEDLYMSIANDRLNGVLPVVVREQELVRHYHLTLSEVRRVLSRILAEGWAERLPGYGWRFSDMLEVPEAYAQLMRFRQMFEPLGLLEPAFQLNAGVSARLRRNQQKVLELGSNAFSAPELFLYGCEFHEALAEASRNLFVLDALKRANTMRRLYSYRSNAAADAEDRITRDIEGHLHILDLVDQKKMREASRAMAEHLRPGR